MPKASRFSPHDHLVRQGWKGKGTALKHGHATRPLPVVQKKSMSGIGKDRDEAVPFWDHIFASTAASLASAASSGTSTPTTSVPAPPKLSIAARSGRELARRKLYSGFFRSTGASAEHTPRASEDEAGGIPDASGGESGYEAAPSAPVSDHDEGDDDDLETTPVPRSLPPSPPPLGGAVPAIGVLASAVVTADMDIDEEGSFETGSSGDEKPKRKRGEDKKGKSKSKKKSKAEEGDDAEDKAARRARREARRAAKAAAKADDGARAASKSDREARRAEKRLRRLEKREKEGKVARAKAADALVEKPRKESGKSKDSDEKKKRKREKDAEGDVVKDKADKSKDKASRSKDKASKSRDKAFKSEAQSKSKSKSKDKS